MRSRSDTPRTDKVAGEYRTSYIEKYEMMLAHAIELETELSQRPGDNWQGQAREWRQCAAILAEKCLNKDEQPAEWQVGLERYLELVDRYTVPSDPHGGRAFDREERGEMPEEEA